MNDPKTCVYGRKHKANQNPAEEPLCQRPRGQPCLCGLRPATAPPVPLPALSDEYKAQLCRPRPLCPGCGCDIYLQGCFCEPHLAKARPLTEAAPINSEAWQNLPPFASGGVVEGKILYTVGDGCAWDRWKAHRDV